MTLTVRTPSLEIAYEAHGDPRGFPVVLLHGFPDDALERIREKKLDVLIRFGFNILRGEILTAARYGVWYSMAAITRHGTRIPIISPYRRLRVARSSS